MNYLDFTNFKLDKSIDNNLTTYKPKLVDKGVKFFFKEVLKGCHNYKQSNYNSFFNIFNSRFSEVSFYNFLSTWLEFLDRQNSAL